MGALFKLFDGAVRRVVYWIVEVVKEAQEKHYSARWRSEKMADEVNRARKLTGDPWLDLREKHMKETADRLDVSAGEDGGVAAALAQIKTSKAHDAAEAGSIGNPVLNKDYAEAYAVAKGHTALAEAASEEASRMAAASGAAPAGRPLASVPDAELGKLLRGTVDKLMPSATPDRSA